MLVISDHLVTAIAYFVNVLVLTGEAWVLNFISLSQSQKLTKLVWNPCPPSKQSELGVREL